MIHSKHLSAVFAGGVQICPISHFCFFCFCFFLFCHDSAAGENNRRYTQTDEKTKVVSDVGSQTNIAATSEEKTQMECHGLWATFTRHRFLTNFPPSRTTRFHNVQRTSDGERHCDCTCIRLWSSMKSPHRQVRPTPAENFLVFTYTAFLK